MRESHRRLCCRALCNLVPAVPPKRPIRSKRSQRATLLGWKAGSCAAGLFQWSQTHRELNIRLVAGGATGSRSTAQPKAKRYTVPDGTDGSAEERAEEQSHQMQPSKPIFRDIIDSLDDCFRLFDRKVETFRNPPTNA